jgi:tRNA threonylcarbamoyladenosine biosynthesis protein TsaE
MKFTTHSLEETKEVAQKFVEFLRLNSSQTNNYNVARCNIFGFSGDLGSGKTTFTQCVAELLGITEHITSPTFVIQKRYSINLPEQSGKFFPYQTLIHIDAYRLESARELEVLNFLDDCKVGADISSVEVGPLHPHTSVEVRPLHSHNLIFIEWPEKVLEILPKDTQIIQFSFVDEHVRTIEFPDIMTV